MKTVFIILFAIFIYNVEGIKIRAIRRRTIQYIPLNHNQNTHTQTQYFRELPQIQRAQVYKNGRQTYSYVAPGGVRYNMFSGSGAYGNNLINNLNRGQKYQSVHQSWPSSAVQGISVDQNRFNSGYKELIGQSAYQSWQNSASGSPIDISVQQNGINPGYRGHTNQNVYQSWQNFAGGRPGNVFIKQNGVDLGNQGDIPLPSYQNWPNSANIRPNYAYAVQSGLNSGNIGQAVYQNWHNAASERPIVNPGTIQSLESSAPGSLVDFPTDQTILNGHPKYQYLQSAGAEGEINLSVDQSIPNSANGGQMDYFVQPTIPNLGKIYYNVEQSGQPSDNGDQAIVSLNQGEVDADHEPQFINEIKVNAEENIEPIRAVAKNYVISPDNEGIISVDQSKLNRPVGGPLQEPTLDESKLNQPNEIPLQDIDTKYMKENITPVDTETQNYLVSQDNGRIFSVNQSKLNWPNEVSLQNIVKDVHIINDENSPIGAVNKNDPKSPDNYGIISVNQSKLNWPIEVPLQDIMKDVPINNEKNISPIDADAQNDLISPDNGEILSIDQSTFNDAPIQHILKEININKENNISSNRALAKNYAISPDNEGIILVDQSELNWPVGGPLQDVIKDVHINNEKNTSPIDAETQNNLFFPENEAILSVDQSKFNEAPLQDIVKEININKEENITPIVKNYVISPDNEGIISVDQSKLNWPVGGPLQDDIKDVHINNEHNISPLDAETQNYPIFPENEGILSVDQSKFNEASLQDIVKEININKVDNISPIVAMGKNYAMSPDNESIISVDQSRLKWPIGTLLQDIHLNNEENTSPIDPEPQTYLINPDNGGILSVDQSKFHKAPLQDIVKEININREENISPIGAWPNQDPLKESHFKNEEEISPVSIVSEIDVISPNNGDKIIVDQSEQNGADQTPLKDIEKDIYVNNDETVIPVKSETINDVVSSDNIGLLTEAKTNANSAPISIAPNNDLISTIDEHVSSLGQTEFNEATQVPLKTIPEEIKINITENSGPVLHIGNLISNNKYGDQTNQELIPIPMYLNILQPNKQQDPIPRYSDSLKPNQEQSPAPITFKPNQQRNPGFKTMFNQVVTTHQQQPLNIPYKIPPGNLQWNKPIVRNISPQLGNRVFSSVCQNPNTNVILKSENMYYDGKPVANKQKIFDFMDYIKMFGLSQNPPFTLEPLKIGRYKNADAKPIFNKKEMYPYYKVGNIDINKYNIPQPSYYGPTPSHAILHKFNVQFENNKTNKNPVQRIDIEAIENEKTSGDTNANFYTKGIYPFYKSGKNNIKKHSPQQNHYAAASSPAVKNEFNINSEYFTPDENLLSQISLKGRNDYAYPNFYKKEINPYNKLVYTNLNKYTNPQAKYYIPTYPQAVRNKFDTYIDNFKPSEFSLRRFGIKANEDEEVVTNPPDSRIIHIKPNGQKTFTTESLVTESPLVSPIARGPEITGYEKPTTPKEYVYQVANSLMSELLRLYNSKCNNEYVQKLLAEFRKLLDSIQGEHCK